MHFQHSLLLSLPSPPNPLIIVESEPPRESSKLKLQAQKPKHHRNHHPHTTYAPRNSEKRLKKKKNDWRETWSWEAWIAHASREEDSEEHLRSFYGRKLKEKEDRRRVDKIEPKALFSGRLMSAWNPKRSYADCSNPKYCDMHNTASLFHAYGINRA